MTKAKGQSDRAYLNRSAMSSGKPDHNAITITNGKSPDRSKNMSVISQGQHSSLNNPITQQMNNHPGSHNGSSGVIGTTRSPYLGMPSSMTQGGAPSGVKKRGDKDN